MNWYLAKMIFRIVVGEGHHQPQFDEQLRLIAAIDEQSALEKAKSLGVRLQERFLNQQQRWVSWEFMDVTELSEVDSLEDGAELHYQIAEPENPEQYIGLVHRKAADIARNLEVGDWALENSH